ncbi:MAG: pseudouridine synthase [Pseudomonadota bacterium]
MPKNPPKKDDRPEGDRIAKLLARAGVASRREVERMIADKRITHNGKPVETPATFLTDLKGVSVDGKPVGPAEPTTLVAFNKPTGLITAERDPAGRATIYSALRNALPKDTPRLMPIGRLDLNTEGLLLLTNDGGLKRQMELPKTGIPRTYRARAFGEVKQDQLEDLSEGVEIDGVRYGSIDANLERGGSGQGKATNHWIEMTITEGKNREVRRVLEYLDLKVNRLIRTAYGPFLLGDLPRGQAAIIRKGDLSRFQSQLKRGYKA